jgi:hypothetical protein
MRSNVGAMEKTLVNMLFLFSICYLVVLEPSRYLSEFIGTLQNS